MSQDTVATVASTARYETFMGEPVDPADYVHPIGDGRWVVATYDEKSHTWSAPMSRSAQRMTGCHTVAARTLAGIAGDPCAPKYLSRSGAVRAAMRLFGWARSR